MKKLVLVLGAVSFLGLGNAVNAKDAVVAQENGQAAKKVITADQLPEPVKQTLSSEAYQDLKVEAIAEIAVGDQKVYEVVGKKGDVAVTLKFDAAGKELK